MPAGPVQAWAPRGRTTWAGKRERPLGFSAFYDMGTNPFSARFNRKYPPTPHPRQGLCGLKSLESRQSGE